MGVGYVEDARKVAEVPARGGGGVHPCCGGDVFGLRGVEPGGCEREEEEGGEGGEEHGGEECRCVGWWAKLQVR